MAHCPADTAALHESVPSPTVTLPDSAAPSAPGALTATLHCTVSAWPNSDGLGVWDVIVVVVSAALTVTMSALAALLLSLLSSTTLAGSIPALPPLRGDRKS